MDGRRRLVEEKLSERPKACPETGVVQLVQMAAKARWEEILQRKAAHEEVIPRIGVLENRCL
jgi:hypothetical protein